MDLATLKARGGVVSAAPVRQSVEWTHDDPETGEEVTDKFDVFILRHSFGAAERLYAGATDRSKGAQLIASCVRFGEDGKDELSYEDAHQLDPGLAAQLIGAINRANAPKNSRPRTKSGTSSSSTASAAAPSQKQKKP